MDGVDEKIGRYLSLIRKLALRIHRKIEGQIPVSECFSCLFFSFTSATMANQIPLDLAFDIQISLALQGPCRDISGYSSALAS